MKVLALNPYAADSHVAFMNGWVGQSRHDFTVLSLPGYHWKWRMRQAGITLSEQINALVDEGERWDALFCTDMVNLAELKGLLCEEVRGLKTILYFHENQLTYPDEYATERDFHFAFTNFISAGAADAVWFNSEYHYDVFFKEMRKWLGKMPDYEPLGMLDGIESRSEVHEPGIDCGGLLGKDVEGGDGVLHIVWVARWEADKRPEIFFEALRLLKLKTNKFKVSVLGRSFGKGKGLACFERGKVELKGHIKDWGYLESREDYAEALCGADVVVSTAGHEFFGIAVVEAVASGAYPVLPNALSYPYVMGEGEWLYDGSAEKLTERLVGLIGMFEDGNWPPKGMGELEKRAKGYDWDELVEGMDGRVDEIVSG